MHPDVLWQHPVVIHEYKLRRVGTLHGRAEGMVFLQTDSESFRGAALGGSGGIYGAFVSPEPIWNALIWLTGGSRHRAVAEGLEDFKIDPNVEIDTWRATLPGSFEVLYRDLAVVESTLRGRVRLRSRLDDEWELDAGRHTATLLQRLRSAQHLHA